jgi:hypothetical protein
VFMLMTCMGVFGVTREMITENRHVT